MFLTMIRRRWLPIAGGLLLISLFAGLHLLAHGYHFGLTEDAHAVHLPFLEQTLDPALFPGDPMLATRSGYPSFYFLLLALATRLASIPTLFLIVHLLTLLAYLAAVAGLSLRLAPDRLPLRPLLIGLLLTLSTLPVLGGDDLVLRSALPRHVGLALALWALLAGLLERRLLAFALAGLSINLHALSGGFALALLLAGDLLRLPWRRWAAPLLAAALGLLLALPTLIWSWQAAEPLTPAWIDLLRLRSSQHSFPLTWPLTDFVAFGLWIWLAGLAWWPLRRNEQGRWLAGAALAVALLAAIGFMGAEVWPLGPILRWQLFRSTRLLTVLALPLVVRWFLTTWDRGGLARAGSLVTLLALFAPWPIVWIAGVLAGGLLTALASWAPLDGLARAVAVQIVRTRRLRLGRFLAWPAAVRWTTAALLLALLVSGAAALTQPRVPADLLVAWRDVQIWARENTPVDAAFITPPYYYGFRVESQRPVVGEWKDGTQQYFSVPFTAVWWQRMQDLHAAGASDIRYNDLSAAEVTAIAQKYQADFIVFFIERELPFPVVYRNQWFRVYQVSPG
ncbi:MAG: DUF6798 domain-containing protein [Anaerolineae bacterium]